MLEPWNNALLKPPPINTFLCNDLKIIDLENLRTTLQDIVQVLSNQSPLHHEGAILSRLIYKFDKKFRNDIGYHNLKKVNTALRRYLKINLVKDVENFSTVVPAPDSDDDYLPTRQMLEYVLVRLQSFSKVMVRICVCAKKSAIFYWDRVTRGESHWMSLMPYAVVCRIWSLVSILLKHACKWYMRLYQYLNKLQPAGLAFLPQGYLLPDDIEKWLDSDNIDEHGTFHWSKNKCIEVLTSLEEEDNEEAIDIFQYVQNVGKEMSDDKVESEPPESCDTTPAVEIVNPRVIDVINDVGSRKQNNVDFGEAVPRKSLQKLMKTEELDVLMDETTLETSIVKNISIKKIKRNTPSTQMHSVDMVTNEKDMKVFIAKEERLRNNGNKESLTSHLGFMQWQSVKTAVNNLYDVGLSNEKIVKKFKKIWKNKCTVYL